MKQTEKDYLLNVQWSIVRQMESNLTSYDYIGTKIAEGVATKEDYAREINETIEWRKTLNKAQDEIKRLEKIEVEPDDMPPIEE